MKNLPINYKITILLTLLLCNLTTKAQSPKNAFNWKLGRHVSIEFTSDSFLVKGGAQFSGVNTFEGGSSFSDSLGNLLLYADAERVYNRLHQPIPFLTAADSSHLGGNTSASQSGLVIPIPQTSNLFYVFFLPAQGGRGNNSVTPPNKKLAMVKVNLLLNGGLGAIEGPVQYFGDTGISEMICYTKICNNNDYWLMTYGYLTNEFLAYRISSSGIIGPIKSKAAFTITRLPQFVTDLSAIGALRFSKKADLVAINIYNGLNKRTAVYNFDVNTGTVGNLVYCDSNTTKNKTDLSGPYGLTFSPNSRYLYSSVIGNLGDSSRLVQYDLKEAIAGNADKIKQVVFSTKRKIGALQQTPNAQIWFNNLYKNIGAITNPHQDAAFLKIIPDYIKVDSLPAYNLNGNFPYFPEFWFTSTTIPISIKDTCRFKPTQFTYTGMDAVLLWEIKDSIGNLIASSNTEQFNLVLPYQGKFSVHLTTSDNCTPSKYILEFNILDCPCLASLIQVDSCLLTGTEFGVAASFPIDSVRWFINNSQVAFNPLGKMQRYFFDSIGLQSIKAEISLPCGNLNLESNLNVLACQEPCPIYFPSAFTPGNDDFLNANFGQSSYCEFSYYYLRVSNRTGHQVFTSHNPAEYWDGTHKGVQLSAGVYYYQLNFRFGIGPELIKRGTITLLR